MGPTRNGVGVILERESELAQLTLAVQEAAAGVGSVALVSGPSGIGKSSLIAALRPRLPAAVRVLVGACDDLRIKRPLGPFHRLLPAVGGELAAAIEDGDDREAVFAALRAELIQTPRPTVLVIEDAQWADEATLDALRFIAPRLPGMPAVLVLTYREDSLGEGHPLRRLIGRLAHSRHVHRIAPQPLSPQAVGTLSAGCGADAGRLFAITAGNPFFLTELLDQAGGSDLPESIADAVEARMRRLTVLTRDAVERLSVIPWPIDLPMVHALVPGGIDVLAQADRHALLRVTPAGVAFRHELIRCAIADTLPTVRRIAVNRAVLAALESRGEPDLALLMHHAAEAGDVEAITRYGPDAAADAAAAGAHREAAAHYRLVLAHRERFRPAALADLLEGYARECAATGAAAEAIAAQREAVTLCRKHGWPQGLGAALGGLSRLHWGNGDRAQADCCAGEAVDVLERAGDPRELAMALSTRSQLAMLTNRNAEAVEHGQRAAALAARARDPTVLSHALATIGLAQWRCGEPIGKATLDEALRVALDAGDGEGACRAYVGLVGSLLDDARFGEAQLYLTEGLALADGSVLFGFVGALRMKRARLHLAHARWEDAEADATAALEDSHPASPALTVLGRARIRRGLPGGDELLAKAWRAAVDAGDVRWAGQVTAALLEDAWLRGAVSPVPAAALELYDEISRGRDRMLQAELAFWLGKMGADVEVPAVDHPYALLARGLWSQAALAWQSARAPYEYALALAESDSPDDGRTAVAELDAIGARPLARIVRARLATTV